MANLLSFVSDSNNGDGDVDYTLSGQLVYIKRDYLPVISAKNATINQQKFRDYLLDLCEKVHADREVKMTPVCNYAGMEKIEKLFDDW